MWSCPLCDYWRQHCAVEHLTTPIASTHNYLHIPSRWPLSLHPHISFQDPCVVFITNERNLSVLYCTFPLTYLLRRIDSLLHPFTTPHSSHSIKMSRSGTSNLQTSRSRITQSPVLCRISDLSKVSVTLQYPTRVFMTFSADSGSHGPQKHGFEYINTFRAELSFASYRNYATRHLRKAIVQVKL